MGRIKLDRVQVGTIKGLCETTTLTDTEIAKIFNVSRKHINAIRNKKRWNYNYEREYTGSEQGLFTTRHGVY